VSTATPPGDGQGDGPEEPREGQQPSDGAPGQTPDQTPDQTFDRGSEQTTGEPVERTPDEPVEQPGSATAGAGVDVDAAWAQIMAHWNEPAVDPGTRSPARPGRHRRADGHDAPEPPAGPEVPPRELRRRRTDHPAPPPAAQGPSALPGSPPSARPPAQPSAPPVRAPRPEGARPGLPDGRGGTESDPLAEEHYVPPEPPPLPRGSWRTWLPWVGVLGVPLFFVVVVVLRPSLPSEVVLVAVLGFVAGFLTLVLRLPDHRDDDGDDGARV